MIRLIHCKSYRCWFLLFVVTMLFLQGCAATKPPPIDPLAYKDRTKSSVNEHVTVTVAVPTIAEAQAIYGVDLASKEIQPVWLEVKNESANIHWFLPSGLDPEYFSPSEAAFPFHTNIEKNNKQLDDKFRKLHFKNPIQAGSSKSGFVLVNLDEGFKAVDIDLVSREDVKSFSFVIPDPDFKADFKEVDTASLYAAEDIIEIETKEALRRALEELPCCTANADGDKYGDPLNIVLIGDKNDIVPAFVRRNWHATEVVWSQALKRTIASFLKGKRYRYSPISPLYVFGRRQDIGFQKARGTINERNHMRFWQSPIRFRGKIVYIGQISRDIGVKFTLKSPTISTHIIDPDVDEARRYLVEDLAYSQAVSRLDFVKGVGTVTKDAPKMNLVGDPFYTDGLRAVLFFEPRPYTLSDIIMPKWEIPPSLSPTMNDHAGMEEETVSLNDSFVKKRAITEEDMGIRASTAVVGDKEAKEIFGIDLAKKDIQAVWLEIENNSDRSLLLLPIAIDQDYFAPLEVAIAYHKSFSTKSNKTLDERILQLNFPIRNRIVPGSTASGYILTNWSKGMKVIDVDLLGQNFSQNFTFFAPNPDTSMEQDYIERIETMFSASELKNIVREDELRDALAQLPCCVSDESGNSTGEPMNVVLIGAFDDWTTAFSRRGYRSQELTPRYAFGREPDLSGRKQNRGYTQAQSHTFRLWQLPIRYSGLPVWAGQVSSHLGGRFSDSAPSEETLPLNPRVDEARIGLMQDLAYSQAVTKIGHVRGAGRSQSIKTDVLHKDKIYSTDGLRVVIQFSARPASLAEINFYNWERLTD